MSVTYSSSTVSSEAAAYGGFVDALGGIATIVLAIIGLSGIKPDILVSISTIVFGAALLIQGGAMLSEFAMIESTPETSAAGGGGLSSLFMVGVAGIVLGVLALLGVYPAVLTSVAVIAFGAALVLSSSSVWQLLTAQSMAMRFQSRSPMVRLVASEIAIGSSGMQAMTGLAVIVLGILAVAGIYSQPLTLIALLAAGATLVMTGGTLSGMLIGFMRHTDAATPTARPVA
ncbi:MAG TPA: hypothetical protein VMF12_17815 [Xanthobacteraceae bacterium]|nr:hypothetical protein [Xanthobacteraceae bacterium]